MASSAGNPNQNNSGFDVSMLFKPSTPLNPNPNPNPNPNQPPVYASNPSNPQFQQSYTSPQIPSLQSGPPYSYPPQTAPFHHYMHYPQDQLQVSHQPIRPNFPNSQIPVFPAAAAPSSSGVGNPTPGARLMALLSNQTASGDSGASQVTNMELTANSESSYSQLNASVSMPTLVQASSPVNLGSSAAIPAPTRLPSSKLPKGRHVLGDKVVYDIDVRLPGEVQPQLEVNPITKYVSDPGLYLGRQIAVNGTYICYGLKMGPIRILNINTASRHLIRVHSQRITDMAFFAEDVHLLASASVDGRIYIWKIIEASDEEDKAQITAKIIFAVQMVGEDSFHPRVCWHTHKQEVLMVGIGKHVLRIDTTKVAKGEKSSDEEPVKCPIDKPVDGIYHVGKHDGDVTDMSICQWMTSRLATASTDGTVKIWGDRKSAPLFTFRPYDGQPVSSVTFLVSPQRPDHIFLLTAGPHGRELKTWSSASHEGWLLHGDSESWQCTQSLELKSSSEQRPDSSFFNQISVLSRAGLILLANARKNAIYAVHVEYGLCPSASRLDYIAEFTVTMPILSLTAASENLSEAEPVVQIYCVQTQAIQQYTLHLSQCLPPSLEHGTSDLNNTRANDVPNSEGFALNESNVGSTMNDMMVGNSRPQTPLGQNTAESSASNRQPRFTDFSEASVTPELAIPRVGSKPNVMTTASSDSDSLHAVIPRVPSKPNVLTPATSDTDVLQAPLTPRLSGRLSGYKSPSMAFEDPSPSVEGGGDRMLHDSAVDRRVDAIQMSLPDVPSATNLSSNVEINIPLASNMRVAFDLGTAPAHPITPSEILSMAAASENEKSMVSLEPKADEISRLAAISNEAGSVEDGAEVVGENGYDQQQELEPKREAIVPVEEKRERAFYSQASDISGGMGRDCTPLSNDIFGLGASRHLEESKLMDNSELPSKAPEEENEQFNKDVPSNTTDLTPTTSAAQSPLVVSKGKEQKLKASRASASANNSPFNSTDSLNGETGNKSNAATEVASAQIVSIQESMNQLVAMQKEMLKQVSTTISTSITKEGKRIEAAIGRNTDRVIKANIEAMWARLQEENAKHEKAERDRVQQMTNLMSNTMTKDLPAMIEKALKKEIAGVSPAVTRNVTSALEKLIPSAVADAFQKGVSDKVLNQLEKLIGSKLEAAVNRQIHAQFQSSVKQILQDALRTSLESSLIPAFEVSCKSMFEQIDAAFQKGMAEHASASQQHLESGHMSLALTLQDAIKSASSLTQTLSSELAEGHRQLMAYAVSRSGPNMIDPANGLPVINAPQAIPIQQLEAPIDPTIELSRLISEHKYEEVFTTALQKTDLSLVAWLCNQVDLQSILSARPVPLTQGVVLSLVHQLACDLVNDTSRKLSWLVEAASVLSPDDPMIVMHARPILEQVYQMLLRQQALGTTADANTIRMAMHLISLILKMCK